MNRTATLTVGTLAIATLTLGLAAAAFAEPESRPTPRAPRAPKDALVEPKLASPPSPPSPLSLYVARPGEQHGFVVVASDAAGGSHQLKVEARDGRVVIATDPQPDQPWLGILYNSEDDGVRITGVVSGSPAEAAGLKVGDLMTELDGRDIGAEATSGASIMDHRPGDRVTVTVERDGKKLKLPVTLGSRPGSMEIDLDEDMTPFGLAGDLLGGLHELKGLEALKSLRGLPCVTDPADCVGSGFSFAFGEKPRLGVLLESMSPQLAEYFGTEAGKGLLVMDVVAETPAARAGVKAGDVLLRVGTQDIRQASDVRTGLQDVSKGESATVEVLRRGRREAITVTMDSDPPAPGKQSYLHHPRGDWREWAEHWRAWGDQWKDWGAAWKDAWKDGPKDTLEDGDTHATDEVVKEALRGLHEAQAYQQLRSQESMAEIRERLREAQEAAREAMEESREEMREAQEKLREELDAASERQERQREAARPQGGAKLMGARPERTTSAPAETDI